MRISTCQEATPTAPPPLKYSAAAANIRAGILDLFRDSSKLAFYDFNLTSNSRNNFFSVATYYPPWVGTVPEELGSDSTKAFGFFSSINMMLRRYNGTYLTTFVESGLQWDAPNAWPPHQYIALQALRALPSKVSSGAIPQPPSGESAFALVPSGQLGLQESLVSFAFGLSSRCSKQSWKKSNRLQEPLYACLL